MADDRPRLVFMGTPDLARVVLAALANVPDWQIPLVVAQPDKVAGRRLLPSIPPVKQEALERGIPVLQPSRCRHADFIQQLRDYRPDVIVVAAYGQILPTEILSLPPRGCLNVHTSLLPRWRGAAPIQWAILEGDDCTGVTLMQMDAGLDTGPIITSATTRILPSDTGQELHDRLAQLGAALLVRTLPDWIAGRLTATPQSTAGVTYARKLTKEDGLLDWTQPSTALHRRIRALVPWPGAYTVCPEAGGTGFLLKVWAAEPLPTRPTAHPGEVVGVSEGALEIATGHGVLQLLEVQREGRRRMSAREFLAGTPLNPGTRLGVPPPGP